MYDFLKQSFSKGGIKRMKYTIPPLISAYLQLASKFNYGHHIATQGNDFPENRQLVIENFNTLDITNTQLELHFTSLSQIYSTVSELIYLISPNFPEIAFKSNMLVLQNKMIKNKIFYHFKIIVN